MFKIFKFDSSSKSNNFTSQTVSLMVGQGFGKIISFIAFVILARLMGPSPYGSFTFALSVASILAFIPNMGTDPFFSREVSAGRESGSVLLGVVLTLKLAGSLGFLFIYIISIFLLTGDPLIREISFIIGPAMFFLSLTLTGKTALITYNRAEISGVINIFQSGSFLILIITFYSVSLSIKNAAGAYFISQIIGATIGLVAMLRIVGFPRFPSGLSKYVEILKKTLPLALIWFLSDLYLRIDTSMLFYFKGNTETGLYGASYRLVDGVCSGVTMICTTALPRFSHAWAKDVQFWKLEWVRAMKFMIISIFLPVVAFTFFPKTVIQYLYGPSFSNAASSLQILGPGTMVLSFGFIFGIGLTSIGQERNQLLITLISLMTNIILNLILIPILGGVGAALATLASGVAYIAMALLIYKRYFLFFSK